jgi:secreted trypsin-like serine protease
MRERAGDPERFTRHNNLIRGNFVKLHTSLAKASLAVAVLVGSMSAHALGEQTADLAYQDPNTGNSSSVANWRFAPGQLFNGVAALDGVARISFSNSSGSWACSGSLLAGGEYVLTAAHCADDFTSMTIHFGWYANAAAVTRTVAAGNASVHPMWTGELDTGADIAVVKLNAPVTTIPGYNLSTTNDVGKTHLMAGYGTTSVGSTNSATNWADGGYGHYGYNTFDVTSNDFNAAVQTIDPTWGYDPSYYLPGITYMVDFDNPNGSQTNNTLGRVAGVTGNTYTSGTGLGTQEALIAGGDSGGGDFVWDGSQWLLSGVHSWGWQGNSVCFYINVGTNNCDVGSANSSSYGDLSGSTAVVSHLAWINSVTAVPEPQTPLMLLAGLAAIGGALRRRGNQRQA